jgi:hypothetical protein
MLNPYDFSFSQIAWPVEDVPPATTAVVPAPYLV